MRFPSERYQMHQSIAQHFPNLRPAQQRGLTLWVYGTILAQSACQDAVATALLALGFWQTARQHLREWLYDGSHKARPCSTQLPRATIASPQVLIKRHDLKRLILHGNPMPSLVQCLSRWVVYRPWRMA